MKKIKENGLMNELAHKYVVAHHISSRLSMVFFRLYKDHRHLKSHSIYFKLSELHSKINDEEVKFWRDGMEKWGMDFSRAAYDLQEVCG